MDERQLEEEMMQVEVVLQQFLVQQHIPQKLVLAGEDGGMVLLIVEFLAELLMGVSERSKKT